ncbi:hypothetical protein DICA4_E25730 [Diutina catenulata]
MSLYHPSSRSMSSRVNCLTPHDEIAVKKDVAPYPQFAVQTTILSPPLSPYQRSSSISTPITEPKSYLNNREFKLENHQDYKLTISAWGNLTPNYKQSVARFLGEYAVLSQSQRHEPIARKHLKRRLAPAASVATESDTDFSDTPGVRTRRGAKRTATPAPDSSFEDLDSVVIPRKKKPKPAPSLALQQQALVDETIPDYSPDAFATLPANNTKCLKIEWKGQPMDLSGDPDAAKIHPAEVVLASILRLPVFVYLDSKRRLFFEKVQRAKQGKQFRRTDAQKACRIDVNKASRLFAAFEKVGWLKDEHFTAHL